MFILKLISSLALFTVCGFLSFGAFAAPHQESKCERLTRNAQYIEAEKACAEAVQSTKGNAAAYAKALNEHASLRYIEAKYPAAERLYTQSKQVMTSAGQSEHVEIAHADLGLAVIATEVRDQEVQAIETMKRALSMIERAGGTEHAYTVMAYHSLCVNLVMLDKLQEADQLCQKAARLAEKIFGTESSQLADVLLTYSSVLDWSGDCVAAQASVHRALVIYEKTHGPEHPSVAAALLFHATFASYQSGTQSKEAQIARANKIVKKVWGTRVHPAVADAFESQATVDEANGDYEKALRAFQQSLEIRTKLFGVKSLWTAKSLDYIADNYISQSKIEAARDAISRAANIREAVLPKDNVLNATTRSTQGRLARKEGKGEDAKKFSKQAIAIYEKSTANSPSLAYEWLAMGELYADDDDYKEAKIAFDRALTIRKKNYQAVGGNHPEVAYVLKRLGQMAEKLDDAPSAEKYARLALTATQASLPNSHLNVAEAHMDLADFAWSQENWILAEEQYRKEMEVRERNLNLEKKQVSHEVGVVSNNLGLSLEKLGRKKDAETFYRKAIGIQESLGATARSSLENTLRNLSELLSDSDKVESQKLKVRADKLRDRINSKTAK